MQASRRAVFDAAGLGTAAILAGGAAPAGGPAVPQRDAFSVTTPAG